MQMFSNYKQIADLKNRPILIVGRGKAKGSLECLHSTELFYELRKYSITADRLIRNIHFYGLCESLLNTPGEKTDSTLVSLSDGTSLEVYAQTYCLEAGELPDICMCQINTQEFMDNFSNQVDQHHYNLAEEPYEIAMTLEKLNLSNKTIREDVDEIEIAINGIKEFITLQQQLNKQTNNFFTNNFFGKNGYGLTWQLIFGSLGAVLTLYLTYVSIIGSKSSDEALFFDPTLPLIPEDSHLYTSLRTSILHLY